MTDVVVVLVTAPSIDEAAKIARTVVEEGLAACANLVAGVRSIYRWKGELCDEPEVLMILKARADRFDALRERIVSIHPYEVPEVIRLPVEAGHQPYLDWVRGPGT